VIEAAGADNRTEREMIITINTYVLWLGGGRDDKITFMVRGRLLRIENIE
jgi:hypothetical protein